MVDYLFIVAAIVSFGFCVCHYFVMHYIVSFLILQSTRLDDLLLLPVDVM